MTRPPQGNAEHDRLPAPASTGLPQEVESEGVHHDGVLGQEALPAEAPPEEALPAEALPAEAPPEEAPPEEAPPEEVLQGGVANAGGVVRVGNHVLRPSNAHSPTIHRFLTGVRSVGFHGASEPVAIDADGRERLVFIPGDVAVPPFPMWAQSDDALASVARLMAQLHAASLLVDVDGWEWSSEMVDRDAGSAGSEGLVVCHNDVCLENVVFRDGVAVGLLDFDFAAPGRPAYDVAQFVRMCVPVTDDEYAHRVGFESCNRPAKVRMVCDAYDEAGGTLGPEGRQELLAILDDGIARSGEWVRSKVEAGHPGFIAMWEQIGGQESFDRRRLWWSDARFAFAAALA